jgi:tripartite-type tricarboxylate transporter receptor subunit TctC
MAAAVIFSAAAGAQTYPNKAVRLLVPQGPGGGNDTIARMVGQKLTGTLKQQFAIDNRAGAGGLIAAELASKAPADGYTLFLGNVATLAIIPNAQKKTPYDPLKDFEPITLLASAPQVVAVHPSLPVKSMKDLITLAKAKPGMVNYASNGVGSSNHLATELFVMLSGVKLTHVPYKGLAPALTDVLSGEVLDMRCELLKNPYAYVQLKVKMTAVHTGRVVFVKEFEGERQAASYIPGSGDPVPTLRNLTSRALQDAVDKLVDDPEMRRVMRGEH